MAEAPDYRAVEPPPEKEPEDYSYVERRAEILSAIERAGSPSNINQHRLADRYGVSDSQISQDVDRLGEYIGAGVDHDELRLSLYALRRHAVDDLLAADDWRATKAAWQIEREFAEWVGVVPATDDAAADAVDAGGDVENADLPDDVDPDAKVPRSLDPETEAMFDELIESAERESAETRVDANGDDLSAEDLGLDDADA